MGIKQVAEAARVSPTTVSHALNGKGRIPEETRNRIQKIADDLGYRPSAIARNLLGGRTGLLGLVVPSSSDVVFPASDVAYFVRLTSAATRVAMENGYALVVASQSPDGSSPFNRVEVDGAIVVDPVEFDPLVLSFREAGIPVVTNGRVLGADDAPWVDNDHNMATRRVLEHLARRGAERPGLFTSQPATSFAFDVETAYRSWCAENDISPQIVHANANLSENAAAEAARRVLDRHPACDAIFATLDRLALATLHEARIRHVSVPQELLVVGATDSEAAHWAAPSLTVLNLQPDVVGSRAAEILIELVQGREPATQHITVPTKLITRGSTRRTKHAARPGRSGVKRSAEAERQTV